MSIAAAYVQDGRRGGICRGRDAEMVNDPFYHLLGALLAKPDRCSGVSILSIVGTQGQTYQTSPSSPISLKVLTSRAYTASQLGSGASIRFTGVSDYRRASAYCSFVPSFDEGRSDIVACYFRNLEGLPGID